MTILLLIFAGWSIAAFLLGAFAERSRHRLDCPECESWRSYHKNKSRDREGILDQL